MAARWGGGGQKMVGRAVADYLTGVATMAVVEDFHRRPKMEDRWWGMGSYRGEPWRGSRQALA
jgi:hypothetical protein